MVPVIPPEDLHLPTLGLTVTAGEPVEVPDDVAVQLIEQGWQTVDGKAPEAPKPPKNDPTADQAVTDLPQAAPAPVLADQGDDPAPADPQKEN